MEIFGGFMIMSMLLGLLMLAIWIALPILVFSLRTQVEKNSLLLARIEQRLAALEDKADNKPPCPSDRYDRDAQNSTQL
jgi:hypothetical protein